MTQPNTSLQQSFQTGTLVGLAEVYLNHPLWALKTRLQCGYPFTLSPRILYRGAFAEAVTMVPVDIIQMVISTGINERVLNNNDNRSFAKRVAAGFAGGAVGGTVINGIESIMTLQQKYNSDFLITCQSIIKNQNVKQLLVGAAETSVRNGIYNTGFFALAQELDKTTRKYIKNEKASILTSGLISGVAVSIFSHPFDTVKTMRQAEENGSTARETIEKLYKEGGVKIFFRGLLPRSARVISGISVMSLVYQTVENKSKNSDTSSL